MNQERFSAPEEKPLFIVDGYEVMKVNINDESSEVTLSYSIKTDHEISSEELSFGELVHKSDFKKTLVEKNWIKDDIGWTTLIPFKLERSGEWEQIGKLFKISFKCVKK